MRNSYGGKLYCFSPPVMLATFLLEFGAAIYAVWRYKMTAVTRIAAAMLVLLGVFQLTEYMICGGLGLGHVEWAKLGYVSITILPALGLHLVLALAKVKNRPLLVAAYGTAAVYVLYFALVGDAVISRTCSANYAVFEANGFGGFVYALYYYGWLLVTAGLAAHYSSRKKVVSVMRWMLAGYAAFIIPTTFFNLTDPSSLRAIPSVMCGFAVLLALVLVLRVLPLSAGIRR